MKTLKTILAEATAHLNEGFTTSSAFKEAHKKIEAAGFVKSRQHSSPGMNYYEHENGHTIGLSDTASGTPEIETANGGTVAHKDLDSHLASVSSVKEEISEATAVTHAALTKKVVNMFGDHFHGNDDYETVHLRRNAQTGATKHSVGSVKAHSLAYKAKPDGNAYTGGVWDKTKKYADHPLHKGIADLIKKHGGTQTGSKNSGTVGGFIDTSDGYRHHFSHSLGSNYNAFEHQVHKHQINEMTDDEIDAHNDRFNDKVLAAHDKYIAKHYGKNADVNWGAIHDEDEHTGAFTSKVYHPHHGKVYVTTHYDPKTHKVIRHEEE